MGGGKRCAVLKPGQYRGSHKIRLHGGKYTALGQKKDVTFIEIEIKMINMT